MEVPIELLPQPERVETTPEFLIRDRCHSDNVLLHIPDRSIDAPNTRSEWVICLLDRDVRVNDQQPAFATNDIQTLFQSRPLVEFGFLRPENISAVAGHWERLREFLAQLDRLRVIPGRNDQQLVVKEAIPRRSQSQDICIVDANGNCPNSLVPEHTLSFRNCLNNGSTDAWSFQLITVSSAILSSASRFIFL